MTEEQHNVDPVDLAWQPLADYWTHCVHQANETTQEVMGSWEANSHPQAWRRKWFEVLSQQVDGYLRTPEFLQVLRHHIDALVLAKRRTDPPPRNLDLLTEALCVVEQTMRSQMTQLAGRWETLEHTSRGASSSSEWERILATLRAAPTDGSSKMGTTPHEIVYEDGTLKLLRYINKSVKFVEPVLICFALVNRPYILDLQEDRSVVRQLVDRGFDVYLIDWGVPTDADRTLRMQDYVDRLLPNVANFVCQQADAPQLNLLGYCMGGTLSTMFTALHPGSVRNLILMATPIDFDSDEGLLNLWAHEDYFDVDELIDAFGNCPGEFLQYCFQLMKPVQNFAEKYLTFCERFEENAFLENFLAMERWANDSIPVAGETFREYVKMLYQQNRLVQGKMSLGNTPVNLAAITCPLLLLVADQDHLVPPDSTFAIQQLVRSEEVKSMSINAGHIGLAVSSKAHRQLWPAVANWIADHSSRKGENSSS